MAVTHVRQSHNWDCGLACAEMVLRALGTPRASCSLTQLQYLLKRNATWDQTKNAVWTVDIAYLLRAFGVRFKYFTQTIGVDPALHSKVFYKSTIDQDSERIKMLFGRAHSSDIVIEQASLSQTELRDLLTTTDLSNQHPKHMVIALVDSRKLYSTYTLGFLGRLIEFVVTALGGDSNSDFTGHFVLITGYESQTSEFSIIDPASQAERVLVSAAGLDIARRSHGTDEDLLIIPMDQAQKYN